MSKQQQIKNYRSRNHCLILYPDDPKHLEAMDYIHKHYDYAAILHDKDLSDDLFNLKKAHYHYVIRFKDARWRSSIALELGITENYLEECRNLKNALLYLLHYNDSDKHPYSIDDVKGCLKKRLNEILKSDGVSEIEKVASIIEFIDSCDNVINYKTFVKWTLEAGCWDAYRRAPSIWHKVIEEHNYRFIEHNNHKNYNI